jgi:hypothetical protein
MHCYRYLAAVSAIAETVESLPETRHRLPLTVLADWMEENGIEAEDVLAVSGAEVRAIVESAIRRDDPQLPNAA